MVTTAGQMGTKYNHISKPCHNKVAGHQDEATCNNITGGSLQNKPQSTWQLGLTSQYPWAPRECHQSALLPTYDQQINPIYWSFM